MKTWRDSARPIIQQVLKETKGQTEKEIKKALFDAYPFGERKYHPYKIWCHEIQIQRGKKRFPAYAKHKVPENQQSIF